MESEITRLVTQLARIRNVEVGYVYDTLEQSIIAGLKRRFGRDVRHEVAVDAESGKIDIAIIQTAVKLVENISLEISLDDARMIKPDAEEGEEIRIEIPLQEVGRVAIQRTVDELTHRLREAERTKLFNEFIKKKGEIISGTIHKIEKEEIQVNLGPIYGILPLRDQLKTDHHQIGAPFKFFVLRVDRTPIGPRVYLSRTHPEFLKRLLTREVPEIQQNIVEIKGVSRIPGVRSKVAVTSHDEKIDPIGACVGYRKVRIQNVTKELSGEKIDVIPWSADESVFISRAMSPAQVNEVIAEGDSFTVVVPDDEFSKAIGRKGQNVWLASLLTSSKLDILKESDYRNRLFSQRMSQIMIDTLDFLSEETRHVLIEAGFTTVVTLYDQPVTEVAKSLGWDPTRIEQLKTQIREQLEKQELEKKLFEKKKLEEMRAAADESEAADSSEEAEGDNSVEENSEESKDVETQEVEESPAEEESPSEDESTGTDETSAGEESPAETSETADEVTDESGDESTDEAETPVESESREATEPVEESSGDKTQEIDEQESEKSSDEQESENSPEVSDSPSDDTESEDDKDDAAPETDGGEKEEL